MTLSLHTTTTTCKGNLDMAFVSALTLSPIWTDLVVPLQNALAGLNGFCVVCW